MPLFFNCNVLTTLLSLAFTVLAACGQRSEYAVKEFHHVPTKWSRVGPAPAEHLIQLQIALKQSQFSELERHLYEGTLLLYPMTSCQKPPNHVLSL